MTNCVLSVALLFVQPIAPTAPGRGEVGTELASPRPILAAATTATLLAPTEQPPAPVTVSTADTLHADGGPPPEPAQPAVQPQQRKAPTPPADRADPPAEPHPSVLVDALFGWPGRQLVQCESSWNRFAVGRAGERGLFQIHPVHRALIARMGYSWDDMFEVEPNIRVAVEIRRTQGLRAWTCWKAAA